MSINFPANPALDEAYTYNGNTYIWDGSKWVSGGATFFATREVATAESDGLMPHEDKAKLDGIPADAGTPLSAAEIKTAYESNADTNAFTDDEKTKLGGIPADAGTPPSPAEIKASYESNADTNAFTDSEKTKLANVEEGPKADLVNGVVPNSQLPSVALTEYLGEAADETAMLALDGQPGDWAIRTDLSSTWIITGSDPTQLGNWTELATPANDVTSVNGYTGTVVLSASDVGAAPSTVDLQTVTDNGNTTDNAIIINTVDINDNTTAQGEHLFPDGLIRIQRPGDGGSQSVLQGWTGGKMGFQAESDGTTYIGNTASSGANTSDSNITLNADGSSSFAGAVSVSEGTFSPAGKLEGLTGANGSAHGYLQLYGGGASNPSTVFNVFDGSADRIVFKGDGSADFKGIVTVEKEDTAYVAKRANGVQYFEVKHNNYQLSLGTAEQIALQGDSGNASFAGTVSSDQADTSGYFYKGVAANNTLFEVHSDGQLVLRQTDGTASTVLTGVTGDATFSGTVDAAAFTVNGQPLDGGSTDLNYVPIDMVGAGITSSTGSDAIIPLASPSAMGLMSTADKNKLDSVQGVPAGTIITFGGIAAPTGYVECNGAPMSKTGFPELFNAIGTLYGGTETTFYLPDLRGEFVRGWDNGRGVDSGRQVATNQDDEFKSHTHADAAYQSQNGGPSLIGYVPTSSSQAASAGVQTSSQGGSETRPRNVALMYCIKT